MRRVILAIAIAIAPWTMAAASDHAIGARIADTYALPATRAFAEAAGGLETEMANFCASPDAEPARIRPALARTITAWARVSILRFGPLTAENRFERIMFWPDPRGVVLRQVQALLADAATPPPTAADLGTRSVAIQGLGAFEFAVFGNAPAPMSDHRCRYAQAVAANIAALAAEVDADWHGSFRAVFANPATDNRFYRSADEITGELLKAMTTGLQSIRDGQIVPALGQTPKDARGRRAPFWRSDLGIRYLEAQIRALHELYAASGLRPMLEPDTAWIDDALRFDLDHAASAIAAVKHPTQDAFAQAEDRARLAYAATALKNANRTVSEDLAAALGLVMGFNALDGD